MTRISTNMPNIDSQYYLRRQEERLANVQSQIGAQSRLLQLRDDPLAASHAVRYESYIARLERFESNTLYSQEHLNLTDGYLRQTNDILQRLRDLSVQGANGVYTQQDMRYMAVETNELLKELVSISNALGPDGRQLFAGDRSFSEPFRVIEGVVEGSEEPVIAAVEYRGAGASRKAEISEGVYGELDLSGGEAFWAEKMQVFSSFDASDYRVASAGAFYIDGQEITVNASDTVRVIASKINESAAPVKAYIDPETNGLALEGTSAHLIRVEDASGSSVMRDLGVITRSAEAGAPNWNSSAKVSGGSIFDMVIRLRDGLFRGDTDFIGTQGIGGIDFALNNVQKNLAEVGSRAERAAQTWGRINEEIPNVTAALTRETGLDFAAAATDLSMLDFAHKAALQTASKVLSTTLLDYLR
ncbi:MAG: flagellar hook-associated protein 3 [Treponema sp.]|nr:flagellar hook-associated protein 3 [Treponema sp.]